MNKLRSTTHSASPLRATWLIILVCVVLFACNILLASGERKGGLGRDMTGSGFYTLSEASIAAASELSAPVALYYYPSLGAEADMMDVLLQGYAQAGTNIQLHILNAETAQSVADTFLSSSDSLDRGSLLVTHPEGTRYRLLTAGDLFTYNDDYDLDASAAEANICSAIRYVSTGVAMHVYFLTGHSETPTGSLEELLSQLDDLNYDIGTVDLSSSAQSLSPQTDILMVVSPKYDLAEEEYESMREFLGNGGRAVFLMDRCSFSKTQGDLLRYDQPLPYFDRILTSYGLGLQQNVIVGGDPAYIGLRATTCTVSAQRHNITAALLKEAQPVVFSDTSAIMVDTAKEDTLITPLVTTADSCYAKVLDDSFLNLKRTSGDQSGSFLVGALAERDQSRIVLYGTSSFVSDDNLSIEGNRALITGTLDHLSPRDLGLDLPPKSLSLSALDAPEDSLAAITAVCCLLLPALVLGTGLHVYLRRKRR
ncbi:MAG: Gldg family protein [Christensenellaceae bacterium]|nr:Gldg family protein [Christensenellaceae bacterium]